MSYGLMENVICEAKIQVEISGGRTAPGTCDGILLPIEIHYPANVENLEYTMKFWKCSKCKREVK